MLGRWAGVLAAAGVGSLLLLSLAVVADVLMRWLFRSPIFIVADLSSLLTAIGIAACFATAICSRQHIAVTSLGEHLGGWARRALEAFGALAVMVFFGLSAWKLTQHALDQSGSGETTLLLGLPVAPAWWIVALAIAFAFVCAAVDLIERLRGR